MRMIGLAFATGVILRIIIILIGPPAPPDMLRGHSITITMHNDLLIECGGGKVLRMPSFAQPEYLSFSSPTVPRGFQLETIGLYGKVNTATPLATPLALVITVCLSISPSSVAS
jgi:hypothetical protein